MLKCLTLVFRYCLLEEFVLSRCFFMLYVFVTNFFKPQSTQKEKTKYMS